MHGKLDEAEAPWADEQAHGRYTVSELSSVEQAVAERGAWTDYELRE